MSIDGYGSLKGLNLKLKPFSVLIGANGQGKSLILEALARFFTDFNSIGGAPSQGVSDALWFRRETDSPITFDLTLVLEDAELAEIVPKESRLLERLDRSKGGELRSIRVRRVLQASGPWKTESIRLGEIPVVANDVAITPDGITDYVSAASRENLTMYFFSQGASKDNITGDRLLVNRDSKKAFTSTPALDELVRRGVITASTETIGKAYQQWAKEQNYAISPPSATDLLELGLVQAEQVQKLLSNLAQLRTKFRLIPAARDVRAAAGQRASLLDPQLVASITTMSNERKRQIEKRWERYRDAVQTLLRRRLEPNPTQILLKEGDFGLQPAEVGGGEQAIMGLIFETLDAKAITAIEEPENHLHPELQRSLLGYLRQLANRDQVIITTHSPVFASQLDATSVFLVAKSEDGATTAEPVGQVNVARVIHELGIKPADLYEYDTVVFVEGSADVKILSAWSGKLAKDRAATVGFVDAEGWTSMDYYANARVLDSRRLRVQTFVLFDGDTESDPKRQETKRRLNDQLKLPEGHVLTLPQSSIESYLLVPAAIHRAIPKLRLSAKELEAAIKEHEGKKNKKQVLDQILRRAGVASGYDTDVGQRISQAMNESEISDDIKSIFNIILGAAADSAS